MKIKKYSRKLKTTVVLCLLLTTTALASVAGQLIDGYNVYMGAGMELSKGVYWTGSDYRTENYIEYKPNSNVYPVVTAGSKVCNYGSFSSMASRLENQGKHVIAGMNGDYYVMANYMPLGIVVEDGLLRSSDAGHWAVGFKSGGEVIFGKPALAISIDVDEVGYIMDGFNKTRSETGAVIITDDFAATTKSTSSGRDIVCTMSAVPTVSSEIVLTVESIHKSAGAMNIPENRAIISVGDMASEALLTAIDSLSEGDTLKLGIKCTDGWANVDYAIGSLYKLVTNGVVETGLDTSPGPRTAIGKKDDGTIVFYTIDGRQTGHSVGVGMKQLAERMLELGCVEATIMDGGGSTSMNAIYLGDSSASQINSPSDGYQRSVTNYIMLVTNQSATGAADRLAIYPLSTNILSGATTVFSLKSADENGYSARLETPVTLSVTDNLGSINADGTFIASGEGRGSITAEAEGLVSAATEINVVASPDILRVYHEGTSNAVTSLTVFTESSTALMGQSMHEYVYLISQDRCYNWSVKGDVGSIDADGTFRAGTKAATGEIVVRAGDTVASIPVTVQNADRYEDVKKGAWYYDAVEFAAEKGLMNGISANRFDPEGFMSRAMVVTVLHRMEGSPAPAKLEGFSDVSSDAWYAKAVYWANEQGIVLGSNGAFDPDGNVTREQFATILHRYNKLPPSSGGLTAFEDAANISTWARDAMSWAVEKGIITGTSSTKLDPAGTATRAQIAQILFRLNG